MKLRITRLAQQEIKAAIAYYNSQRLHLGDEFFSELEASMATIERFPLMWHAIAPDIRRCRLNRFPYVIIYRVKSDEGQVLAVAHTRQLPRKYD